jgi:hypothetical protein
MKLVVERCQGLKLKVIFPSVELIPSKVSFHIIRKGLSHRASKGVDFKGSQSMISIITWQAKEWELLQPNLKDSLETFH